MSFWVDFWAEKTDGLHRYKTEEFFEKQAREVSFHLKGGTSLLDFGCGSAELLVYYAGDYKTTLGVDFSSSMLIKAKERIAAYQLCNVQLLQGDEMNSWTAINQTFDRIIACGVVQYLTYEQIDNLIGQASQKLTDDGRMILFNFIEPALLFLRKIDAINTKRNLLGIMGKIVWLFFHVAVRKLKQFREGVPIFEIGYGYKPHEIEKIATKYNMDMEVVWSMYYEYRYHVILTKKKFSMSE